MLRAVLPRSWPLLAPGRDGDLGHFLGHGHADDEQPEAAAPPVASGSGNVIVVVGGSIGGGGGDGGVGGGGGGGGGSGGGEVEGDGGGDEGSRALRAELAAARARLREMLLTAGMGRRRRSGLRRRGA